MCVILKSRTLLPKLLCMVLLFNYIKNCVMLCSCLFLIESRMFFLQYSLAYACLKLVNYSFFFWLPFYLSNNFGWKEAEADKLSIWYDVGGIIGNARCIFFYNESQSLVIFYWIMKSDIILSFITQSTTIFFLNRPTSKQLNS